MLSPEQLAQKRKYAEGKKASMKRRADNHDYTGRRIYMITIEAQDRRPLFGQVVGNPASAPDSEDAPHIELSALGKAVQLEWLGIPRYFPQIEVKAIQMMPDHLHGILFVKTPLPVHLGQVISGFKAGCRRAQRELVAAKLQPTEKEKQTTEPTSTSVATTSAGFQKVPQRLFSQQGSSLQAAALPSQVRSLPLFAPGYNDLILRSYDELAVWQNYLRDNPRRLMLKRARPEWLRPFFGLEVGTTTYNGVGNRALLQAHRRIAVKVSRRLSQQEIDVVKNRYLEEARQGAVLVSPAISPGEKQVMRTVFDAGFPTIVLLENGFTTLSKPHGEQFYACAEGRLLMLSPWQHHNEKRPISAQQCRQLNFMALELCQERQEPHLEEDNQK